MHKNSVVCSCLILWFGEQFFSLSIYGNRMWLQKNKKDIYDYQMFNFTFPTHVN